PRGHLSNSGSGADLDSGGSGHRWRAAGNPASRERAWLREGAQDLGRRALGSDHEKGRDRVRKTQARTEDHRAGDFARVEPASEHLSRAWKRGLDSLPHSFGPLSSGAWRLDVALAPENAR